MQRLMLAGGPGAPGTPGDGVPEPANGRRGRRAAVDGYVLGVAAITGMLATANVTEMSRRLVRPGSTRPASQARR